jgi:intein-encoded DNA endonuclease-like protein
MKEMAEILDCSTGTVWRLLHRAGIQVRPLGVSKATYNPNLEPSEELAFLIGAILGDGNVSIYERHVIVKVDSKDDDFAEAIFHSMRCIGLNPFTFKWKNSNGNLMTRVFVNSVVFGRWLKQLQLSKFDKLFTNEKQRIAFIRGFFDAEGYVSKKKEWNSYQLDCRIINTNIALLQVVGKLINSLGFQTTIYAEERILPLKTKYSLYLRGGKKAVTNFINLIHPTISRKLCVVTA